MFDTDVFYIKEVDGEKLAFFSGTYTYSIDEEGNISIHW